MVSVCSSSTSTTGRSERPLSGFLFSASPTSDPGACTGLGLPGSSPLWVRQTQRLPSSFSSQMPSCVPPQRPAGQPGPDDEPAPFANHVPEEQSRLGFQFSVPEQGETGVEDRLKYPKWPLPAQPLQDPGSAPFSVLLRGGGLNVTPPLPVPGAPWWPSAQSCSCMTSAPFPTRPQSVWAPLDTPGAGHGSRAGHRTVLTESVSRGQVRVCPLPFSREPSTGGLMPFGVQS